MRWNLWANKENIALDFIPDKPNLCFKAKVASEKLGLISVVCLYPGYVRSIMFLQVTKKKKEEEED